MLRNMPQKPPVTRIRRESDLIRVLDAMLRDVLPDGWDLRVSPGERVGRSFADAVLQVTAPDGAAVVAAVEAKVRIEGRDLESLIRQARLVTADLPTDEAERGAPVIAARFLSPIVRARLDEAGLNYADATGNVRLSFTRPGLFVAMPGAERDPVPEEKTLRSLKGGAAARVVRALYEAEPPVKVRDLKGRTRVGLATISRVIELLDRDGVVERDSRGTVVGVDRPRLVERWVQDYGFSDANAPALFLEPRDLDRLLAKLRDASFPYAVTGSLAARLVEEYAEARLAMIYVEDVGAAAEQLNLTPVDSGGNVLLAEPNDRAVLDETWERDGVEYAPLAQVAADLLTSPGRGPAEGEELLRVLEARRRG